MFVHDFCDIGKKKNIILVIREDIVHQQVYYAVVKLIRKKYLNSNSTYFIFLYKTLYIFLAVHFNQDGKKT